MLLCSIAQLSQEETLQSCDRYMYGVTKGPSTYRKIKMEMQYLRQWWPVWMSQWQVEEQDKHLDAFFSSSQPRGAKEALCVCFTFSPP